MSHRRSIEEQEYGLPARRSHVGQYPSLEEGQKLRDKRLSNAP